LGTLNAKARGWIPKQLPTEKNGMDVLYPHAKFGGDLFMHDNTKAKIKVSTFLFLTDRGLILSQTSHDVRQIDEE